MEQGSGRRPYAGKYSQYANVEVPADTPSTYQARYPSKPTSWEKVESIVIEINKNFNSLGEFLSLLFHNRDYDLPDPRQPAHTYSVSAFLHGNSNVTMATIIPLIYHHRAGKPTITSSERGEPFSPTVDPLVVKNARPALLAWAAHLVGKELHRQMLQLSKNDPHDPHDTTQLRASTKGRAQPNVPLVTWEALGRLSMDGLAETFSRRAPLPFFITEWMAAPRENGRVITRQRRPHPMIQVGAMSSFALSLNPYATGFLAMAMGIWLYSCKAHIDQKRIMSRFGYSVHDRTIRDALATLSQDSLSRLKADILVDLAADNGAGRAILLDNVQEFIQVHEERIGRSSQLKIGTAATAIRLDHCAPGAWDLKSHLDLVAKQDRVNLSVEGLFSDIDWAHVADVQALHWVRTLVEFIPELVHYKKQVSALFRGRLAIMPRAPGRKTNIQPLGTNAEKEVETAGMMRAILDFETQMGLSKSIMEKSGQLFWIRGDGASHAAVQRIKRYLLAHPSDYDSFRNRFSLPEVWHTRSTQMNSTARNHYGPVASRDPSSLSKSSVKAGIKRPPDLKKCDFYSTSRSMTLIWSARVLDIWRIELGADNGIADHFDQLPATDLPTFDNLLARAKILVKCYASQQAYERALSKSASLDGDPELSIRVGSPWKPEVQQAAAAEVEDAGEEVVDDDAQVEDEAPVHDRDEEKEGKVHVEKSSFDGDRCLANEALFLETHGWWIEAAYAVPEGDIGRLYQILKIWIFVFTGTSNRNYSDWMLDMYCLFKYEASQDLSNAILQNMLVNVTGELGKCIEGDLLQEHYNRWLEDMVSKKGGNFDDKFYRQTLAPNVNHFLRIKEQLESAFNLKARSKAHTSPHLRNEYQRLLAMYKEEELHLFRSGRSLGHAAVNHFGRGYKRLEEGRIATYIKKTTAYASIMADARALNDRNQQEADASTRQPSPPLEQLLHGAMQIERERSTTPSSQQFNTPGEPPVPLSVTSTQSPSHSEGGSQSDRSATPDLEDEYSHIPQETLSGRDEGLEYDSDEDRSEQVLSIGEEWMFTPSLDSETGLFHMSWDFCDEDGDDSEGPASEDDAVEQVESESDQDGSEGE
ncbi:hypothetical protein FIBSPDRAFT_1041245 [Athelia psychrophila]|uniref:DUF6589 domain-containing protein n=1 Tax=Athelia psychrophila TaxID=1759441 RepID=A0A166P1C1_9AGAM|nr:hypothetical protein FIBSPDRAFT_1041245 [Fibularhizoctonia sp. CBS 109695]